MNGMVNHENHRPWRVLCVDDEPNILSALKRVLRRAGHEVDTATSGAAGLDLLDAQSFDMVISDMRMPEMDGAAFLERVRQGWPDTVRILLTGFADVASTVAAINRGEVYRYIAKPWNDDDLLLTVAQALERKALQQERDRLQALTQTQNEALTTLNAELEQRVAQRTEALAQANAKLRSHWLTSVKIFTSLMELRGGALAGHSRRVADMARRMANQMALGAAETQDIFLAGLLHDVGKLGLPDNVLAKPHKDLTSADLVHYRKHPQRGEQALMALDEFKNAALLVRHHHERYDGRGFPDGLEGTHTPVGAQILALANDLDNLLHGQLGQQALSIEQTRQRVQELSGSRYAPAVVEAWLDLDDTPASVPMLWVTVNALRPGDLLAQDWTNAEGVLLLSADHELDARLIQQIRHYQMGDAKPLKLAIHPRKGASHAASVGG
jgi:response regulator RpfG family c-di-GMP phosphodiesterase